jgi:hypothetical protein
MAAQPPASGGTEALKDGNSALFWGGQSGGGGHVWCVCKVYLCTSLYPVPNPVPSRQVPYHTFSKGGKEWEKEGRESGRVIEASCNVCVCVCVSIMCVCVLLFCLSVAPVHLVLPLVEPLHVSATSPLGDFNACPHPSSLSLSPSCVCSICHTPFPYLCHPERALLSLPSHSHTTPNAHSSLFLSHSLPLQLPLPLPRPRTWFSVSSEAAKGPPGCCLFVYHLPITWESSDLSKVCFWGGGSLSVSISLVFMLVCLRVRSGASKNDGAARVLPVCLSLT